MRDHSLLLVLSIACNRGTGEKGATPSTETSKPSSDTATSETSEPPVVPVRFCDDLPVEEEWDWMSDCDQNGVPDIDEMRRVRRWTATGIRFPIAASHLRLAAQPGDEKTMWSTRAGLCRSFSVFPTGDR